MAGGSRRLDARVGDIIVFEPKPAGGGGMPLSQSVVIVDERPYSHAVLVDAVDLPYQVLSANQGVEGLASGVNRIALSMFSENRGFAVLRPPVSADAALSAVDWARPYVEAGSGGDRSNFGWEELVLAAAAGLTRQMTPHSGGREMLWTRVHDLSWDLEILPWQPRRWDCCEFVVRSFEGGMAPLGITESDPKIYRAGTALRALITMWTKFAVHSLSGIPHLLHERYEHEHHAHVVPDAEANEKLLFDACRDADESHRFEVRQLVRLLDAVERKVRARVRPAIPPKPPKWPPQIGEAAWAPFISPRMLEQACEVRATYLPGEVVVA